MILRVILLSLLSSLTIKNRNLGLQGVTILKFHCRKHYLRYNEMMIAFKRISNIATLDLSTYYSGKKISNTKNSRFFLICYHLPRYDIM